MALFTNSDISDEALLKRARYGGRNVTALAILATLFAVAVGALLGIPTVITGSSLIPWLAAGIFMIAAAYWILAAAVRRGGATALSIILGLLAVQFVLSIFLNVYTLIRTKGVVPLNLIWIVVPLLVIAALARNRTDLQELRKRGLWLQLFGPTDRTRTLTYVGGALLIAGYVTLNGGVAYTAIAGSQNTKFRREFMDLVRVDQRQFLDSMASPPGGLLQKQHFESVLAGADQLLQKAKSLAERTSDSAELRSITATYVDAISKWKAALLAIREEGAFTQRVQALLAEGDALCQRAITEFDRTATGGR